MKDLSITEKRCLELARIIRTDALKGLIYYQGAFCEERECGTAACVAGYAVAQYDPGLWLDGYDDDVEKRARELLGLDEDEGDQMFWSNYDATREQAAAMLENYVKTKVVKWN